MKLSPILTYVWNTPFTVTTKCFCCLFSTESKHWTTRLPLCLPCWSAGIPERHASQSTWWEKSVKLTISHPADKTYATCYICEVLNLMNVDELYNISNQHPCIYTHHSDWTIESKCIITDNLKEQTMSAVDKLTWHNNSKESIRRKISKRETKSTDEYYSLITFHALSHSP